MPKVNHRISKRAWEKLSPAMQELYLEPEEDGDDYILDSDDQKDLGPLRRTNTRLKRERDNLRDERRQAIEERDEALSKLQDRDRDDRRREGDIEGLEEQWLKEKADLQAAHAEEVARLQNSIKKTTIDSIVTGITSSHTGTPENAKILDPHVRAMLDVQFKDGEPNVLMKSSEGEMIPFEADNFTKAVVDNDTFKSIIVSKRSSGGGAAGQESDRRGDASFSGSQGQDGGEADLSTMHPEALANVVGDRLSRQ